LLIKVHQELKAKTDHKKKDAERKKNNKKFKTDHDEDKENMPMTSNGKSIDLESLQYQDEVAESLGDLF